MKKGIIYGFIESLYFKFPGNLATYCQLTGVYNRNWFEYVGKQKYLDQNVFVTFIDIDKLKEKNNTEGHITGNELIKKVANTLKEIPVRKEICRYGGDEFLIISKTSILPYLESEEREFSFGEHFKSAKDGFYKSIVMADEMMYYQKRAKEQRNEI